MKAGLEPVADAPTFAARLRAAGGDWRVEIETYRGVEKLVTRSSEEAAVEFEQRLAEMPRDLMFRAFRADCELAWHGIAGVDVRLGKDDRTDLPYLARPTTLEGPLHAGQKTVVTDVVEISKAGRVIYRALCECGEDEHGTDQA